MPDAELAEALTNAALRLISASQSGDVEGNDVAQEIGRDPDDIAIYNAFREVERRGDLECLAWEGGMGLPTMVRLPRSA